MNALALMATLKLDSSDYDKGLKGAKDDGESFVKNIKDLSKKVAKALALYKIVKGIKQITSAAVEAYSSYEQLVGGVETLFGNGGKSFEEYAQTASKSLYKFGQRGEEVKKLQEELIKNGYDIGATGADGIYGPKTQAAFDAYAKAGGQMVKDAYNNLSEVSDLVLKNADEAWATAGLSANQYMETVTSFSASLIQSLGGDTKQAAELSDVAIRDMADNANKMGTEMGSIQNAYAGFAKQNYTMLDNLKLGYGGTKTEMERLIADANKLRKEQGLTADLTISKYSDIITAIHTVQENMGITGTTAKEAEHTVEGSLKSTKAAWQNLLTSMGRGKDFNKSMGALVKSAKNLIKNVMPIVSNALKGIGMLIKDIAPVIIAELPSLIRELLPALLEAVGSLVGSIITSLPSILEALWTTITTSVGTLFDTLRANSPAIDTFFGWIESGWNWVKPYLEDFWTYCQDTLWPNIQAAWDNIKAKFEEVKDTIIVFWDTHIKPKLEAFWKYCQDVVWPWVLNAWTNITATFNSVKDTIVDFWDTHVQPKLEAFWKYCQDTLWPAIQTAWSNISNAFISIKDTIVDAYDTYIAPKIEAFKEKIGDLPQWILARVNHIRLMWEYVWKPWLQSMFDNVITYWTDNIQPKINDFIAWFRNLFDGIVPFWNDTLLPGIQNLLSWIQVRINHVRLMWEYVWKPALIDGISQKWSELTQAFQTAYDTYMAPTFEKYGKAIESVGGFEGILTNLKETLTSMGETLQNEFNAEWLQEQWAWLTDLLSQIQPALDALWALLTEHLIPAIASILGFDWSQLFGESDEIDTFTLAVRALKDIFELLKTVIEALVEIFVGLYTDGMAALNNLLDFITGVFSGNWEKAWEGLSGFVTGALKAIDTWMTNIVQGLENIIRKINQITGFNLFGLGTGTDLIEGYGGGRSGGGGGGASSSGFGRTYHATAMSDGEILRGLTPFGIDDNGIVHYGGEAGTEAVVGVNSLDRMIKASVSEAFTRINATAGETVVQPIRVQLVLDSGALLGEVDIGLNEIAQWRGGGRA